MHERSACATIGKALASSGRPNRVEAGSGRELTAERHLLTGRSEFMSGIVIQSWSQMATSLVQPRPCLTAVPEFRAAGRLPPRNRSAIARNGGPVVCEEPVP